MPPPYRPLESPLRQQRERKDKGEPAPKKVRRTSVGAPLVSESDKSDMDESDTEESETEVGGIASRVRHSRPYY